MQCPFCGHGQLHKHGRTRKGRQRFKCPKCQQTFTESFDTIYYRRQVSQQEVHTILQAHSEGSSLRGVSRISQRAYGTVTSTIRQASQKAHLPTVLTQEEAIAVIRQMSRVHQLVVKLLYGN